MTSPIDYGNPNAFNGGVQVNLNDLLRVAQQNGVEGLNPAPATGAAGSSFGDTLKNMNWGNVSSIMSGIGDIGQIIAAFQQNKIARDNLNFQKQAFQTNLNNSVTSYNTALADRINARYSAGNPDAAGNAAYIEANKMRA